MRPRPVIDDFSTVVQAATGVVNKFRLNEFSSSDFCNPKLQKFYATVEALALEADELDWKGKSGFNPLMNCYVLLTLCVRVICFVEEDDLVKPDAEGWEKFGYVVDAFTAR